jgi:catechol-2,3-dioxygenase
MAAPAPRTARPVKLAHVVLRTRDNYDSMVRWYQTVLDAEVVYAAPGMTFLTYDDEHHRIAIGRMRHLAPMDTPRVGMDHIAFTYADIEDLLHTFARLKAEGIEPFGAVNHGPTTSMYYHDPDGNRIELQVDNFVDMADATALMRETFSVNPIGIDFDPEAAYRALLAGAAKADITRPPGKDAVKAPDPALMTWLTP